MVIGIFRGTNAEYSVLITILTYLICKEGTILAEEGKYWQAINRWDNALSLDPSGM